MKKGVIGVVAAMPEEIAPLLRRVGNYRKETRGGFKTYHFTVDGTPVVLVESGMGPAHATAATELLIAVARPAAILNYGFGGGVLPGLEVGDLVLAERAFMMEKGGLAASPLTDSLCDSFIEAWQSAGLAVSRGTFITAAAIMNKREIAASIPPGTSMPVLEMESAAVVATAARAGIAVAALRGISDAADEELGFSLEEFCDEQLNIRLARILGCVARKPWIIPQLLRLASHTKRAGKTLALGVEVALKRLTEVNL